MEEDLTAHGILEQHISNVVPITGKAIRHALQEHANLSTAFRTLVEEHNRLRRLFDQLTEERTAELLKHNGTDAVVGAIKELTEVVRQAAMPPIMHLTLDKKLTPDLIEQMERSSASMLKSLVVEDDGKAGSFASAAVAEQMSLPPPEEGSNGSPR